MGQSVAKETQAGVDQKAAELVGGGIKMKTPPPEELDDVCMLVIPSTSNITKECL